MSINNDWIGFANYKEEILLEAVKQNGCAISYIKEPSEALQLAAVSQNGYAIKYIKEPSEEVQLAAVKQDGYAIQHIQQPSEAVQLAAVKQDVSLVIYCNSIVAENYIFNLFKKSFSKENKCQS